MQISKSVEILWRFGEKKNKTNEQKEESRS